MDKELKARWVAALRSGQYKQGKDYLKSEVSGATSYCCMGVLCEIENIGWEPAGAERFRPIGGLSDGWLPGQLIERFGLDGHVELGPGAMVPVQRRLSMLNDGTTNELTNRKSINFNQIADWIEVNL